jgi:hypothetical protein
VLKSCRFTDFLIFLTPNILQFFFLVLLYNSSIDRYVLDNYSFVTSSPDEFGLFTSFYVKILHSIFQNMVIYDLYLFGFILYFIYCLILFYLLKIIILSKKIVWLLYLVVAFCPSVFLYQGLALKESLQSVIFLFALLLILHPYFSSRFWLFIAVILIGFGSLFHIANLAAFGFVSTIFVLYLVFISKNFDLDDAALSCIGFLSLCLWFWSFSLAHQFFLAESLYREGLQALPQLLHEHRVRSYAIIGETSYNLNINSENLGIWSFGELLRIIAAYFAFPDLSLRDISSWGLRDYLIVTHSLWNLFTCGSIFLLILLTGKFSNRYRALNWCFFYCLVSDIIFSLGTTDFFTGVRHQLPSISTYIIFLVLLLKETFAVQARRLTYK